MDVRDARAALEAEGLTFDGVEPVAEQGWASWTFELDGTHIVRFPRNAEIVEAMHREMRLLPELAAHVSFRVPVPVLTTADWFVYEKIPGRGFEPGDDEASARALIDELHSFPVERAVSLLRRPRWHEALDAHWRVFEEVVRPELPAELWARAEARRFRPACAEVLVHDDLGLEHILVDDHGRAVGIIDFEDATIGDPDVDLVPLHAALDAPFTRNMCLYRWFGTMHAIRYWVGEEKPDEIPALIDELRERLELEPSGSD